VTATGYKDIGGLDISMHDALGMRRIQRVRDIDCEAQQEIEFEGTAADAMLQGLAFKVLHNDEGSPILLSDIVDGTDVRMVETGSSLSFATKTRKKVLVGSDVLRKKLQGDKSAETSVFSLENNPHTPATKLLDDSVVGDCLANHRQVADVASAILGRDRAEVKRAAFMLALKHGRLAGAGYSDLASPLLLRGRGMVVDDLPAVGKSAKNQGEEAMRSFAVG
jgi:hypothetical protein